MATNLMNSVPKAAATTFAFLLCLFFFYGRIEHRLWQGKARQGKARKWINVVPQTAATTFAFASVFIYYLSSMYPAHCNDSLLCTVNMCVFFVCEGRCCSSTTRGVWTRCRTSAGSFTRSWARTGGTSPSHPASPATTLHVSDHSAELSSKAIYICYT